MHFCTVVPELCWTTTYARCAAVALTHELAGLAELVLGEPPHALTMPIAIRASVALVPMRCLRTVFPPGGQPFPNALLKADRQELPCRCARTGLPLGVQVSWLADRYLSPPSRGPLPQWLFFRTEAPRLQLRDSSGFAPDSLGAWFRILAFLRLLIGPGQPEVTGLSRDWHGEDEAVGLEGELEVAWWETGPGAAHRVCVALAVLEWLEQSLNIGLLVVDDRLHVERARVILGMVGGSDQREHVRSEEHTSEL